MVSSAFAAPIVLNPGRPVQNPAEPAEVFVNDAPSSVPGKPPVKPDSPISFRWQVLRLGCLVAAAELVAHGALLIFGLPVAGWWISLLDAAILAALSGPLLAQALARQPSHSAGRALNFRVPDDPASGLRWVTLTGLGLVVALGIAMSISEQKAADSTASYGQLINLAGRQRMLSQRTARFAASTSLQNSADADRRIQNLFATLKDLRENFELLTRLVHVETIENSARIRRTQRLLPAINARYDNLVGEIRAYLNAELDPERTADSATLVQAADAYLTTSHEMVISLQVDFQEFLAKENRRRLAMGFLMLGTISAIYLLLIDPAIRHLRTQHRAVHARAAELHRLALVAQMTTDAVLIADDSTRIVWANAGWLRISGTDILEIEELPLLDVLSSRQGDPAGLSGIRGAIERGTGGRSELRMQSAAGEVHWVEAEIQPLHGPGGSLSGFIVMLSDITRLKSNRTQLIEQVRQLEESEESANLGHWSWEIPTGKMFWSRQVYRIHGRDESNGPPDYSDVYALYDDDSSVRLREAVDRALASGQDYDLTLKTSDLGERYLGVRGHARRDAEGRICGLHGTVRDVTVQVQADRARAESEERYRQLADSIPTMTWLSGPDKGCTDFNSAWLLFRGRPMKEELGDGWAEGLHPEDRDRCLTTYRSAFDSRLPYAATYRLRRHDGLYRWIEARGVARYSASGEFLGYAGGCVDITALKESQQQLRESEQLLEQTGEAAGVGGWELDLATQEVHWTAQTCRIHEVPVGYRPMLDEAISFYAPAARPIIRNAVEQAIASGASWDLELPLVTAAGRPIWVRAVGQVEFVDGRPVRLYGAFQDITRRKTAESEAVRSSALIQGVLDAAAEFSIIAVDPQGLITIFNRGAERLLGYSAQEMIGVHTPDIIHVREEAEARGEELSRELGFSVEGFRIFVEMAERTGSEQREWTYVRKDGSRFPVSLTVNVVLTSLGEVVGYLGIAQDISARKQAEELQGAANRRLEEANRRAEEMAIKAKESSRLKSEFLANMSHEIRTPMTAILGYTDLLADEVDAPLERAERLDYITTIRRNGEHLLALINDILDVSKIEAGKMTIEQVPAQPSRLLEDVRELMLVKAQAKGIRLDVRCQDGLPATIMSDPVRLKQILVNLVSNAIKFTELGRVTVTAGYDPDGPHGPMIRFDVEDTGIGMTAEQLKLLFEAFQQGDSTTTRRFGGTGLGLRISRRLAELLKGDISVRSRPGAGSVFTVQIAARLPRETIVPVPAEQPSVHQTSLPVAKCRPQPLAGVRVLFAEDGPDNQRLISFLLRKAGAEVRLFETGRCALESLTVDGSVDGALMAVPGVDLILTDMMMPEMDGYELTRRLRAKGCTLPIVALTANAMGGDGQRCLAAGCDAYASKPIEQASLIELLNSALESRAGSATLTLVRPGD